MSIYTSNLSLQSKLRPEKYPHEKSSLSFPFDLNLLYEQNFFLSYTIKTKEPRYIGTYVQ